MNSRKQHERSTLIDIPSIICVIFCIFLYLFIYGRLFFVYGITHANDTHGIWTIPYLMFYSIIKFGEFSWWDPTGMNGWPIYSYLLNWSYNVFSVYSLPYLFLVKLYSLFVDVLPTQINTILAVQKIIYYFILNIVGVYLICRSLFVTRAATVFVLLSFTLGVIQFEGFRDSHQYEILPGALFYLFALFWFERNRTARSFFILLLFGGLFIMSGCYAVVQSPLYWTVLPTLFLILFDQSFLGRAWSITREVAGSWRGRALIASCLAFLVAALPAPGSSMLLNAGDLMRVTGSSPVEFGIGLYGNADAPYYGTPAYQSWTIFSTFMPSFTFHDDVLKFDPYHAGIDHHYVGIVVLPLALIGIILGYKNKVVFALVLTAILCATFLLYTIQNGLFFALMELPLFMNVRTIGSFVPRDGVPLCLILLAGFGLDLLLRRNLLKPERLDSISDDEAADRLRLLMIVGVLIACAALAAALSALAQVAINDHEIKGAFRHVGIFLAGTVSCLAVILAARAKWSVGAFWLRLVMIVGVLIACAALAAALIALAQVEINDHEIKGTFRRVGIFLVGAVSLLPVILAERARWSVGAFVGLLILISATDLTIVGYHYFLDRSGYLWNWERNGAWKPAPSSIKPITSEDQNWVGKYIGIVHHMAGGPWMGMRKWLVLVTHPHASGLVENWNPKTLNMTSYPHFRLFENGRYIPFEAINRIDEVPVSAAPIPWFYLHDQLALIPNAAPVPLAGNVTITEFTLNKIVTHIDVSKPGFLVFYDNNSTFWSAKINGTDAPIYAANFAFKAVKIPAGHSIVEWQFNPWPVKLAWTVSYTALILFLALGWFYSRRRAIIPVPPRPALQEI